MLLVAVVWMRGAILYELCISQRSAVVGDTWQPGHRASRTTAPALSPAPAQPAAAARIYPPSVKMHGSIGIMGFSHMMIMLKIFFARKKNRVCLNQ